MRTLIMIGLLALLTQSCAPAGGGSTPTPAAPSIERFNGSWLNSADHVTVISISSGHLNGGGCNYQSTFTNPDVNGQTTLTITASSGAGSCVTPGAYTCAMGLTEPQLQLNCGAGLWVYNRQ